MTLSVAIRLRLSPIFELNCSFEAPPGFTVLFGPSGAGKTSVLDCIAGLRKPDSGRIAIGERLFDSAANVNLLPAARRLAYVFQDLALFPHMTVLENLRYGISGKNGTGLPEARELLSQFGIAHLADRRPGEASGGERQRVALARSLITNPRALLLDEPLSALDRATRTKIIEDLRHWNEAHRVPIVYVTHSQREALAVGERLLLMESGKIVARGAPAELLSGEDWE
ncbi:MAG TPA: ATP-binding cassette domain-containing protein [Terriglobales bacterium]|nr:ATP-binding cassette domain-containing protein [Terriglobales bacterium]